MLADLPLRVINISTFITYSLLYIVHLHDIVQGFEPLMSNLFEPIQDLIEFPIFGFSIVVDVGDIDIMFKEALEVSSYDVILSHCPLSLQCYY